MAKVTLNDGTRDLACPECGNAESFIIDIETDIYVMGDYKKGDLVEQSENFYADGDSRCRCAECNHAERVKDFSK